MESITNDSVEQKPIATPKLAAALAKFQQEFSNAVRDASGNFGSYVSLAEAEYAVSPATKHGLSIPSGGILLRDDSLVVNLRAKKSFATKGGFQGAFIHIWKL